MPAVVIRTASMASTRPGLPLRRRFGVRVRASPRRCGGGRWAGGCLTVPRLRDHVRGGAPGPARSRWSGAAPTRAAEARPISTRRRCMRPWSGPRAGAELGQDTCRAVRVRRTRWAVSGRVASRLVEIAAGCRTTGRPRRGHPLESTDRRQRPATPRRARPAAPCRRRFVSLRAAQGDRQVGAGPIRHDALAAPLAPSGPGRGSPPPVLTPGPAWSIE